MQVRKSVNPQLKPLMERMTTPYRTLKAAKRQWSGVSYLSHYTSSRSASQHGVYRSTTGERVYRGGRHGGVDRVWPCLDRPAGRERLRAGHTARGRGPSHQRGSVPGVEGLSLDLPPRLNISVGVSSRVTVPVSSQAGDREAARCGKSHAPHTSRG
jgi:hypothetical protein